MKQTQSAFTCFDTTFDLTTLSDCKAFVDALEEMGQIRTWQLYDLICTVEGINGNRDDYQQFLEDITREFGTRVINVARENCLDDAAAKTILSQYSRSIDQYFRSNEQQPFVHAHAKQSPVVEVIERFTLPIGTASEANYVPVRQIKLREA